MNSPEQLFELFEDYRTTHAFRFSPEALYEPLRYFLDLGGKRMRPVLTLLGCDLFDGKTTEALPAAYAIELFHNFTLMHDDIMDNASLRRGKQTTHEKFSVPQAILSGDVMLIYAFEYLNHLDDKRFRKAIDLFNATAIKVCEGQQYDMNFQTSSEVALCEYLMMIEFKTAVLLACSLKLGAIVANADEENANHLFDFGKNMGICFQILDDTLDVFADKEKFGKKTGGDIAENKKTYLLLKAMEVASAAERERLLFYLSNNVPADEKVKGVIEIYHQLGIRQIAEVEARNYHLLALECLNSINADEEKKKMLKDYAESLLVRQS
ncbi:MAG: polyprenyl synthetase family protein [Chitinophagales bacterium]|nr:polyprenyl synthetase family protein [Chitinophagales bacterium]